MAEVFDRLKAALSDRYVIEREIGGGGMATVYLAQDLKLHREVALKVLRPDLAAALGPERFLQEIDIAAKLTHPHILPLHDCGEADGFLYYVMPYVEGESLREKLAKEGELPVGDAVRILKEVVDALAEAHSRGVVHRDIKPDNVMLRGRHALVTDFGVAKAVSEATGRQKLTTAGVALGTPAYMAPEQAAADPHIDHRADIYAVGALAYELLTGRPPFSGTTQQEILAAQVTQKAEPVTRYRDLVPPALEHLVLKCLEKKPADRWQTADELIPHLEALATPSGGVTPTGMMPVNRRVKRSWMTVGGAVVVAAVIVLVLGVWLGSSEDAGPPRLVVLPFENLGAAEDDYFAAGMTDEIRNRLSQLSHLDVIARTSSEQFAGSERGLREIADELDVEYLLEGTVRWDKPAGAPSRVRVSLELIRGSNETQVWAEPFDAVLDDVFRLQGEVAERVARSMRIALSLSERESLAERPTNNQEAYAYYLRGLDLRRAGSTVAAAELFRRAIELDPQFAKARAGLSFATAYAYWWGDRDVEQIAEARSAAEYALRIDPDLAEGHMALAVCHYWGERDYDSALRELDLALATKPDDSDILNWKATVLRRAGRFREAETIYLRALELDPRYLGLWTNLGQTQIYIRKFDVAEETFSRRASLFGLDARQDEITVQLWGKGDTVGAHRLLEDRTGAAPRYGRFWIAFYERRYSDALEALAREQDVLWDPGWISSLGLYRGQLYALLGDAERSQAEYDSARVTLERLLRDRPDDDRVHAALGIAYAGLGRKTEAIEEGRRATELVPLSRDAMNGSHRLIDLAVIYTMVGEVEAAIDLLQQALSIPSIMTVQRLRLEATWDPLRDRPEFQELLASAN